MAWSDVDLAWEGLQERAARLEASGRHAAAAEPWAEALRLAREHFAADDPRLAASLANQAVAARDSGRDDIASRLFDEALRLWDSSGPWVAALRPRRQARSSTFHLRLEAKHPGAYGAGARERFRALAAEGRAAVVALRDGRHNDTDRPARWERERPADFIGARKLLAAVLLIASGRRGP